MLSKFEYDGDLNPSVRMGRFELPIESIKTYSDQSQAIRTTHSDNEWNESVSQNSRVVLIDGSEEDQRNLKSMAAKYSIIESDPTQDVSSTCTFEPDWWPCLCVQVDMKDSTFVSFCIACLTEEAALNTTFKEKTRSTLQAERSFDQLLENFSKEWEDPLL